MRHSHDHDHPARQETGLAPAVVITCSDSVSGGTKTDRSGPAITTALAGYGFTATNEVVSDDRTEIATAVRSAVARGARVVICTGGTGLGPRDVTPEAMADVCERMLPGLGEAFRAASRDRVPTTDLSRATAGTLDDAVIVALPGSLGGANDGMAVIGPLLRHALDMIDGGGHDKGASSPAVTADADASTEVGSEAKSGSVMWLRVGPEEIDAVALAQLVSDPAAGAVVGFEGRVRDHDGGRQVRSLRYEGHPDAEKVMAQVLAEGAAHSGVVRVAASHRVGDLEVGELAFAVAVSAPHRGEAFEAASWLVDEVKERLPVWKKQTFVDGESEWVNCA